MCYQDARITFHRCHPRYQRATIEVVDRYRLHIRNNAKRLNLLWLGDGLFVIQKGRDSERIVQGVEAEMDDFDEAVGA
jgi:hypothetical protein